MSDKIEGKFTCPFCGLEWEIEHDEVGNPAVLHIKPTCKQYNEAEDALAFVIACNKALTASNSFEHSSKITPKDFPDIYKEAWAVYESFRKLGFADNELEAVIGNSKQFGPNVFHIVLKAQDKQFVYSIGPTDRPYFEANQVWRKLLKAIALNKLNDDEMHQIWQESEIGSNLNQFTGLTLALQNKGFIVPKLTN